VRQAVRRRKESPGGLPELKDQTSPSPYDNRHCAGDTENGGEEQVIATQRKTKTKAREQGKRDHAISIPQGAELLTRNGSDAPRPAAAHLW
jgi:hypothetical protein